MQAASSGVTAVVSLPLLLAAGFVVGAVLWALGRFRQRPLLASLGIVVLGLMLIATPFTWYAYRITVEGGSSPLTLVDLFVVELLAAFGGVIIGLEVTSASAARSPPGKR